MAYLLPPASMSSAARQTPFVAPTWAIVVQSPWFQMAFMSAGILVYLLWEKHKGRRKTLLE